MFPQLIGAALRAQPKQWVPLVYTLGHYLSSVTVVEVAALQIFLLVVWRLQYIRSTGCTKGVHSRLFKRVITVQPTVLAADALFRRPSRCQQPILSALFYLLTLLLLSFPPSNWATTALVKAPSVNESLGQQWIEATTTITITTTTAIIVFYIYHLRQLQSLLQLQLFFALILSAVVGWFSTEIAAATTTEVVAFRENCRFSDLSFMNLLLSLFQLPLSFMIYGAVDERERESWMRLNSKQHTTLLFFFPLSGVIVQLEQFVRLDWTFSLFIN